MIACSNLAQVFILMIMLDVCRNTYIKKDTDENKKEIIIKGVIKLICYGIMYCVIVLVHYHLLCLRSVMNYPSAVVMLAVFALFNYYSQQIDRKKYILLLKLMELFGSIGIVAAGLFGNWRIFVTILCAAMLLITGIYIMIIVDKRNFRFYENDVKNFDGEHYNYQVVIINYVLFFVVYVLLAMGFNSNNVIPGAQPQGVISDYEIVFIAAYACAAFVCMGIQITTENYEKSLKNNLEELSNNKDINVHKEIRELYDKTAVMRHDIKHMLEVISAYLSEKEYRKAEDYIVEITGKCEKSKIQNYSNNIILNYILNNKRNVCQKNNIDFKCVCIGDINGIEDEDICLLMGNLLDNAIEAAVKCDKGKVSVDICEGAQIEIRISNSIKETVLKDNPELKTTKKDNRNHGYGTQSIKFIVKKYQGEIQYYEYKNNMICDIKMLSKYDVTY